MKTWLEQKSLSKVANNFEYEEHEFEKVEIPESSKSTVKLIRQAAEIAKKHEPDKIISLRSISWFSNAAICNLEQFIEKLISLFWVHRN